MKSDRLRVLQDVLSEQQAVFNASCNGRVVSVLFEKRGSKAGQAVGRSPWLQPVHVEGAASLIGTIEDVCITDVLPNSLKGELVLVEHARSMVMH